MAHARAGTEKLSDRFFKTIYPILSFVYNNCKRNRDYNELNTILSGSSQRIVNPSCGYLAISSRPSRFGPACEISACCALTDNTPSCNLSLFNTPHP